MAINRWNNMARRLTGLNPLAYQGVEPSRPPELVVKNRIPGPNDVMAEGTLWVNNATSILKNNELWVLTRIYSQNDPALPDYGRRQANWVTVMTTSDTEFRTDDGNYAHPINGILNIFGGTNIATSTLIPGQNTTNVRLKDDVSIVSTLTVGSMTAGGVVTTDATGLFQTSNGTDGQVLIGGGLGPNWATITSSDASVTLTPGVNSLDIVVAPGAGGFGGLKDNGGNIALPDGASTVTLANGTMIETVYDVGIPNTITIGIPDAGVVATPQFVYAPAAGGAASWARIATAGGATITDDGAGTVTITAGAGGGGGTTVYHTDGADAAMDAGDNSVTIVGANVIETDSDGSHTVSVGLTQGANSQIILGKTGNAPEWATLGSSDASITITPDTSVPGSFTLDFKLAAGAGGFGGLIADDTNTALPDGANKVTIAGGTLIDTTAAGNTATVGIKDAVASLVPSNAVQTIWAPRTGGAASWGTLTGIGITVTEVGGVITLTNAGVPGSGINVINCDDSSATPGVLTPSIIFINGDANPLYGYDNITTYGAEDKVYVALEPRIVLPATNAGGTTGVIYLDSTGTTSFIHKYGTSNAFYGDAAGNRTLVLANAIGNVGIGNSALTALTSGVYNTAVGNLAGKAITTGGRNTAIGADALENTSTGQYNVAVGYNALAANVSSSYSTAVGYGALDACTSAGNTAVGYGAGTDLTTGVQSVFVGYNAGANVTKASYNTMIGYEAGDACTTGHSNTLIGTDAGSVISTGFQNVCIGRDAGKDITAGFNNICIGYNAGAGLTTLDNRIYIGNTSATTTYIRGIHPGGALGTGIVQVAPGGLLSTAINISHNGTITAGTFTAGTVNATSNMAIGGLAASYTPLYHVTGVGGGVKAVAAGSSGQVLTSNGPGVAPSYKTPTLGGYVAMAAYLATTVTNVTGDCTKYYLGTTGASMQSYLNTGGGTYTSSSGSGASYIVPIAGVYSLYFNVRLNGLVASYTPPPPVPPVKNDPVCIERIRGGVSTVWAFFPDLSWNGWQPYVSVSFQVNDLLQVGDIIKWYLQIDYRPGPDYSANGRYKHIGADAVISGEKYTHVGVTLLTTL